MKDLLMSCVKWEKLECVNNKNAHVTIGERGLGPLTRLEVGFPMVIVGDYGINATQVQRIDRTEEGVTVKTMNSTYLVKKA